MKLIHDGFQSLESDVLYPATMCKKFPADLQLFCQLRNSFSEMNHVHILDCCVGLINGVNRSLLVSCPAELDSHDHPTSLLSLIISLSRNHGAFLMPVWPPSTSTHSHPSSSHFCRCSFLFDFCLAFRDETFRDVCLRNLLDS